MKRSLELYNAKNYYAGFKAVEDTTKILHSLGYAPFLLHGLRHSNNIRRYWYTLTIFLRLFFLIKSKDICLLQWPMYTPSDKFIYYAIRMKCKHLQIIIHDLTSLRTGENQRLEFKYLKMAELVVSHNNIMKEYLMLNGIERHKIKILNTFDYLIEDQQVPQRTLSKEVVFAGNLSKSSFLKVLMNTPSNLSFLCYGEIDYKIDFPLVYKGIFEPGRVESIKGSWGLVWDGDAIDTCHGTYGDYLRINSPHKISMYIVARLPILIWKDAALANYVLEKGIGVIVDSLGDIDSVISQVSQSDYCKMLLNIDKERLQIVQGKHIINCLS